jgi:hypothetical protein
MFRSRPWLRPALFLAASLEVLFLASPAQAIPAWSRRYGAPCGLCHQYPSLQLTGEGLDFLRRGHRFKGDAFDKDLTHLLSSHVEWQYEVKKGESTAFQSPDFHLHAGGALSSHFSAYVDATVNEPALEVAYLEYAAERGDDTHFTARAGKIAPTLVRNYGNGLIASASTPLILTDAALGENPFTPARDSFGADVGGRWKGLFLQGGVVNGEDAPGQATVGNHKDVYGTAELNLKDGVSGVGVLYYRGGYDTGDPSAGPLSFDRYERIGAFGNFTRPRYRLAAAYLYGRDRIEGLADRSLRGFYVQAEAHPADWLVPFARYDEARTEVEGETTKTSKGTLGCAIRAFETDVTGGRVVTELSRRRDSGIYSNAVLINLLWAF